MLPAHSSIVIGEPLPTVATSAQFPFIAPVQPRPTVTPSLSQAHQVPLAYARGGMIESRWVIATFGYRLKAIIVSENFGYFHNRAIMSFGKWGPFVHTRGNKREPPARLRDSIFAHVDDFVMNLISVTLQLDEKL